jgi:hypothetical protein
MTGRLTPTRGALRACRGVALAGTSTALAIAAHAVGGGGLHDAGLAVLLTTGVAVVGVALANRRFSIWTILAVLGAAQLVTHLLLSAGMPAMDGMPDMAGMGDAGLSVNGATMLVAHAVAVALTAAVLFYADAATFFLTSLVARLLPVIVVAPPPTPSVAGGLWRVADVPEIRPAAALLCRTNARRGPPVAT